MEERLQKIISRAGVASRRHAESLILAGQVSVNGKIVTELGSKADAERDHIKVGNRLLRFPEKKTYIVLHKPDNCVSTMSDPEGRQTVRDLLHGVAARVFPVGRLDYHTQGLLLLTNDGDLANRMLRAAPSLAQVYWIKVKGRLTEEQRRMVQQRAGAHIRILKEAANSWYEAGFRSMRSGNHPGGSREALQKTLLEMGHPVEKMKRVKLASLELGAIAPGEYRFLSPEEVGALHRALAAPAQGMHGAGGRAGKPRRSRTRTNRTTPRRGTRQG